MKRPVHTILAATDGTSTGRLAVVRAASIARETGAALHALHVLDAGRGTDRVAAPSDRAELDRGLRRHLARIHPQPELHLRRGTPCEEIVRLAHTLDAGLVVAGVHPGPESRRSIVDTTAERLARRIDRPLLVVRRPVRGPYRRVLVGVDASVTCIDAIIAARAIAPTATIVPTMIYQVIGESKLRHAPRSAIARLRAQVSEQHERELTEFLEEHVAWIKTAQPVLDLGDANTRLPQLPNDQRCDLIAVGTHGRTGIRHALLGSVAESVLRDADRDVLLARHPRALRLQHG